MELKGQRDIVAKATPAPWRHDADESASVESDCASVECNSEEYGSEEICTANCEDARLIVTMRNNYDALLDIAEAAESLRGEKKKVNDAAKRGTLLATGALTAADEALFAALDKLSAEQADEQ